MHPLKGRMQTASAGKLANEREKSTIMHSIRTKITLLCTIMVVATMIVAAIYGISAIRDMGNKSASETLKLLCETGEKNLDNYFDSVEQSVEMVGAYVQSDLDGTDDKSLQEHLDRVSEICEKLMFKTDGVLTYYYRIDPEVSRNDTGFWYVLGDDGEFHKHEVTDITQYDTSDTSQLVWFTVPKNTGESVWLPPYITDNLGARVLSYNIPIYYEGQFVGVFGIEIDYSTMAEQVDNITLYENGYAFINDSEGTIVYHPRIDVTTMEEHPKVPDGLLGDDNLVTYTFDGAEKLGVWLPLDNGMRLNVSVPVDEVNASWKEWANNIALTFVAMLVLFIVLAMAFSGRMTRPLRDLTKLAERVDEGDYDCELDYAGKDEVGVLARTFNKLVAHLKVYIGDLNDLAYADALTSLRNKGAFNYYMENLQARVNEPGSEVAFAVLALDCNNLKEINDNYGHDKGDMHLQDTAQVICDTFDHSPVFRIGGDEFVAVLQGSDFASRDELLMKFDAACAELRETQKDPWKQVNIARGMAVYDPEIDKSVDEVVRRADKLMYENKWMVKGEDA